ncbi:hypothetical protein T265_14572, partial [Opisthorchis viverrini]
PIPPKNVRVRTLTNVANANVSWEYDSACAATDFLVEVYKKDGSLLMSQPADSQTISLKQIPFCEALYVSVQGRNARGMGQRANSSEFKIYAGKWALCLFPSKVVNELSEYTLICKLILFCKRLAYSPAESLVCDVSRLSWQHEQCTSSIYVSRYLEYRSDRNMRRPGAAHSVAWKHHKRAIQLSFGAPTDINIEAFHDESRITATWVATKKCGPTTYEVTIYDKAGGIIDKSEFRTPPARFDDLPKCVPLFLSVKSRGQGWEGDESERKEFKVSDILTLPKAIKVTPLENVPRVSVSWEYDGPCAVAGFEVAAYRSNGVSIASETTDDLAVMLSGLPMCEQLFVGVAARNSLGTGPRADSSQFTIPAASVHIKTTTKGAQGLLMPKTKSRTVVQRSVYIA